MGTKEETLDSRQVVMIRVGKYVVIQKVGGEHLRVCKVARKTKILIEKLRFEIDGAIDQPFGLFEVSTGKLKRVATENVTDIAAAYDFDAFCVGSSKSDSVDISTSVTSISSTEEMSGENPAQARQKVTQDEIIKMKDTGVRADQLVAKLVYGNVSFLERTVHAQNKYIDKKAKKHSDHVFILKPTSRLVAESYYKKDPERVAHLRIDLLSHMLALSGIHHGSRCIVFEQCLGMLTCAVMVRLGGFGACIHLHRGNTAQSIPCVDSMNFDKKISSVFLPLRISSLLNGAVSESEGMADFVSKQATSAVGGNDDGHTGKVINEDCEDKSEDNGEASKGNVQRVEMEEDVKGDVSTMESSLEKKTERQRLEKQAWRIMQNGEVEILFVATKSVNPVEILERTWQSLRLSSTVVVYCPVAEPLYSTYHWLKAKNAVQVHVVDAFYRTHQIIPDRSHPIMQQFITGGFILSAVKVEQR